MAYDCEQWPIDLDLASTVDCEASEFVISDGTLPEAIFEGTKTQINLDSNGLTGTLAGVESAVDLISLNLGKNQLTGSIPAGIGGLTQLTTLDLSDNLLTGIIPNDFSQLSSLTFLNISGNQFEGCVPCPIDSTLECSSVAGIQSNGLEIEFCPDPSDPITSSPTNPTPATTSAPTNSPDPSDGSEGMKKGTETFKSSSEFSVVMSSLAGVLLFIFVYCVMSAVFLRRKRFLQRVIDGDHEDEQLYALQQAPPMPLRDSSSTNRAGALSFDGRDGWRSETELRTSTRGSGRNSSPQRISNPPL